MGKVIVWIVVVFVVLFALLGFLKAHEFRPAPVLTLEKRLDRR